MIERLICQIRGYAWGDLEAIPRLLGVAPTGEPQAEMWMGSHHGAPSRLGTDGRSLDQAIVDNAVGLLGSALVEGAQALQQNPDLPFLCKFLAAGEPLSIQVHPSKQQAQTGFARENRLGVAISAPERTYRDANHKPELLVALEPFSALCGFRPVHTTLGLLSELGVSELDDLCSHLSGGSGDELVLALVMQWLLDLPAESVEAMAAPLGSLASTPPELSWVPSVASRYPSDAGLLVGLLLNYVVLRPGEGVFLAAGNVHAYLSGLGIEILANSDNVVRCGLTSKNVDVDELLAIASFRPVDPSIQSPAGSDHLYDAPVVEFALRRLELNGGGLVNFRVEGPELVLVTEGSVIVEGKSSGTMALQPGEVAFVAADEGSYALSGSGLAWRVSLGDTR